MNSLILRTTIAISAVVLLLSCIALIAMSTIDHYQRYQQHQQQQQLRVQQQQALHPHIQNMQHYESHGRHVLFVAHSIDTTTHSDVKGLIRTNTPWWSLTSMKTAWTNAVSVNKEDVDESDPTLRVWLVHVQPQLSAEALNHIESTINMKLGQYLPHNTYTIYAPARVAHQLTNVAGVVWVGKFPKEAKLTTDLLEHLRDGNVAKSENVKLFVELAEHTSQAYEVQSPSVSILAAQKQAEANRKGFAIQVNAVNKQRLVVSTTKPLSNSELQSVVDWIIAQEDCVGVEKVLPIRLHNFYGQWITQSGYDTIDPRPIWRRGIRGNNVIVGCADSGLDYDHCMFRDTSTSTPNSNHRKVVAYQVLPGNDDHDEPSGHGTHVVGSIAGYANGTNAQQGTQAIIDNSGAAPAARIYFQDIGTSSGLNVPTDLQADLFQVAYNGGARIHTNSWGASTNSYTSNSRSVDSMAVAKPDMLILFAAGNDGQNAGSITGNVGAPATAKNCLTVGASQTTTNGFLISFNYTDWSERQTDAKEQLKQTSNTDPQFCCNSDPLAVKQYCCEQYNRNFVQTNPSRNNLINVAPFSSRGPAYDGRIKPEVLAPGQNIVSARSDGDITTNNCAGGNTGGLLSMAGTSMATPITAGSAALVMEYFNRGYYPSGSPNLSNAKYTTPSSALMRAVLSNSAVSLPGQIDLYNNGTYKNLDGIYPADIFQGFGRINLGNVLYFSDSTFVLYLDDNSSVSTSQDRDYCFKMTAPGELKATLAWNDPPAATTASIAAVNNLDLVVGKTTGDAMAGNFKTLRDERNNMEHVIYTNFTTNDVVKVKVRGFNVPSSGPQRYALVVKGKFDFNQVTTVNCSLYIAPDQFAAAGTSDYFPYGPVVGGTIGGGVAIILLILVVRWCLQRYGGRSVLQNSA